MKSVEMISISYMSICDIIYFSQKKKDKDGLVYLKGIKK